MSRETDWSGLGILVLIVAIALVLAVPASIVAANPARHDVLFYVAMSIGIVGVFPMGLVLLVAESAIPGNLGGALLYGLAFLVVLGAFILPILALGTGSNPPAQVNLVRLACWTFIAQQVAVSVTAVAGRYL